MGPGDLDGKSPSVAAHAGRSVALYVLFLPARYLTSTQKGLERGRAAHSGRLARVTAAPVSCPPPPAGDSNAVANLQLLAQRPTPEVHSSMSPPAPPQESRLGGLGGAAAGCCQPEAQACWRTSSRRFALPAA